MRGEIRRICSILLIALVAVGKVQAEDEPPVVLSGDRTFIYIDRLPLQGDETLMDVLQMHPELLIAGFENALDHYQLRMENTVIYSNIRQYLTSTPAKDFIRIQICENPGVAKGTPGLDGVIELDMRRNNEGVHGLVNLEGATSTDVAPLVKINYGRTDSANYGTDLYALTSACVHHPGLTTDLHQYADIYLHQQLGDRDKLLVYMRQSYQQEGDRSTEKKYLARARYFHTFNDIGTELLLLAGYQYTDGVKRTGTQMYLVELNTPLPFAKGLDLLAGWEIDIASDRYAVMNNDLYLQLDYTLGPISLSIGDRVSFYNYGEIASLVSSSHKDTRNYIMASLAARPAKGHQLQAGYYRNFINPGINLFQPDSLGEERKADVARLAYSFSHRYVLVNVGTRYIHMVDSNTHALQINASASWMIDWLTLTGGGSMSYDISTHTPYGSVRLAPTFRLPEQWRIAAQLIWYSDKAPERIITGAPVYGLIGIEKSIDAIFDLSLQWHDPFNRRMSAVLFSGKIRF